MKRNELTRKKLGRISYLEGGKGRPILFLHGFPGSAYSWESTARLLLDQHPETYRAIIPDLLGFGESDTAASDLFASGQAEALAGFLNQLGISEFFLVLHDFGGPVGLTLLRNHPELRVHKLVLSATNLFTDTPIPFPLRSAGVPVLGDIVYKSMAGSAFGFQMMYLFAARNKQDLPWSDFKRHITPHGLSSTARIFQHALADLPGNYLPIQDFAGRLRIPALIVWGDRDPFFPVSVAKRSNELIRNSVLIIYEQTGHFVPEERADHFVKDITGFFSS